jgi:hypothetical protein
MKATLTVLALAVAATSWAAPGNRCADCHAANPSAPGHLEAWTRSRHASHGVGCERCHGGDASTFERLPAHRGVLNSRDPKSPTARRNLPITCGTCHIGPFVEFQKSRHYAALRNGDDAAPTCTTCHESAGAHLVSARALERTCQGCHPPDGPRRGREYAAQARLLVEQIVSVRAELARLERAIAQVPDRARRARLRDAFEQAGVPLVEATQAIHAFVFDEAEERLDVARDRTNAIAASLAIGPTHRF